MKRRHFAVIGIIITAALGYIIGVSIKAGDPITPVIAVAVGTGLMYLLRGRVDEIIEDERIYRISEKASYATFKAFVMVIAVIGVVLVAMSKNGSYVFESIGYTLLVSTGVLLVLYLAFYGYFSRKGV